MAEEPVVLVSHPAPHVTLLTLNRPPLNPLSTPLLQGVAEAVRAAWDDENIRAVVLTGGAKAFAAGADLKEMQARTLAQAVLDLRGPVWDTLRRFPKPLIAAVNGVALGGGCELAMHADIIIAGDTAKFGQPEINLGIIPGAGGTQRLTRAVGKSMAMSMVLTGEPIDARAAQLAGLVSEVVPHEVTIERALEIAGKIAARGPVAVRMAKDAVLKSFETGIEAGLDFERRSFQLLFGTEDQREGVNAFLEKRKPDFKGR